MNKAVNAKEPSAVDIEVGRRIRMQRRVLGMSQSALAERVSVTFQQVQKYEKGSNRVGASRLQGIADCLNVPVSFFFEGMAGADESESGLVKGMDDLTGFISTAEGLALNRAFLAVKDPRIRQKIVGLVKSLASLEGDD
ncbi:helix-turn-helix domain-containing protein [Rhizobium mongolense]|uniref:Transcriptional regulator with XRE-family HTH domain n=2 Tax=Rhizobium mongolense TaxID=57676 RepID=A0A7W6RJ10_9HYPH|nr:helix-turn-helix transcriptional regulator [Rhizobium mongolense]MBB4227412.1 transcriptional regulator with XRE-family HTH domain [Rhizobium mongolense]MBB4273194.1 transcriptional regulator with XRE-family HTH domain [Rhizobium mongolense]TVZ74561.1 helix-turn-helix protein [Rhizobium mongolense USDA 1844]